MLFSVLNYVAYLGIFTESQLFCITYPRLLLNNLGIPTTVALITGRVLVFFKQSLGLGKSKYSQRNLESFHLQKQILYTKPHKQWRDVDIL